MKIQEDLKKEREELREQERRRKSEKESGAIVPSSYQDQVPKAREDSEPSKPSSISTIGKPKRMELQPTNIKPVVPNPPRLVSHPSEQLECQATFQPPKSHPVSTTQQLTTPSKRLREDDRAGESPDAFERAVKRPKIATGVTGLRQDTAEGARLRQTLARIQSRPAIQSTISITPLTEVRSPYTQWSAGQTNRPVPRVLDVLAYVTSISPPQQRPIGLKRDFTIRDSSLREDESDVALSVWDEPHGFCPQVGSLVLLRNLKTHHFRGGSLNAYGNECGKKAWAFCGTTAIEKLGLEVGEITEWWSPRETAPPGGSKRPMAGLVPVSTPMDRPVGSDSIFSAADFDEADLHSYKTQDARVAGLSEGQAEPSLQDVPPHDSFGWNDQDFDLKNPPTPEVFAGNPFELPPSSQAVPPEYDDDDFDGI